MMAKVVPSGSIGRPAGCDLVAWSGARGTAPRQRSAAASRPTAKTMESFTAPQLADGVLSSLDIVQRSDKELPERELLSRAFLVPLRTGVVKSPHEAQDETTL